MCVCVCVCVCVVMGGCCGPVKRSIESVFCSNKAFRQSDFSLVQLEEGYVTSRKWDGTGLSLSRGGVGAGLLS